STSATRPPCCPANRDVGMASPEQAPIPAAFFAAAHVPNILCAASTNPRGSVVRDPKGSFRSARVKMASMTRSRDQGAGHENLAGSTAAAASAFGHEPKTRRAAGTRPLYRLLTLAIFTGRLRL